MNVIIIKACLIKHVLNVFAEDWCYDVNLWIMSMAFYQCCFYLIKPETSYSLGIMVRTHPGRFYGNVFVPCQTADPLPRNVNAHRRALHMPFSEPQLGHSTPCAEQIQPTRLNDLEVSSMSSACSPTALFMRFERTKPFVAEKRRIAVFPQIIYLLIRIEIIPHAVPGTVKCHFAALWVLWNHHMVYVTILRRWWNETLFLMLFLALALTGVGKEEFIFCNHFSIW